MTIKRYEMRNGHLGEDLYEHERGPMVLYEDHAAEVARLSALVPIGGDQPLRCRVINEAISIAIGQRILAVAFEFLPSLYDDENDRQRYQLTDAATFAESVVAEMNSEGEDGSTPLTRLTGGRSAFDLLRPVPVSLTRMPIEILESTLRLGIGWRCLKTLSAWLQVGRLGSSST